MSPKKKNDDYKKEWIRSLLSLNISHLHDASNFFALIKRELEKSDPKINDIKNFSKAASFHYRSIFEELKNSIKSFEDINFSKTIPNQIQLLYQKDKLNLNDLLEIELFQISQFQRLKFFNSLGADGAFIKGNFHLLSKLLINLVENAMKYSEKDVDIFLSDERDFWQLKILSRDKAIPEDIITKTNHKNIGHGLGSAKEIMDFHEAKISISSLETQGSSISLFFPKYRARKDLVDFHSESKAWRKSVLHKKFFILIFSFLILLSLSIFQFSVKINLSKKDLKTLYPSEKNTYIDSIQTWNHLKQLDIYTQNDLEKAKGLSEIFFDLPAIDYLLAEIYKKQSAYHLYIFHSVRGFLMLIKTPFHSSKEKLLIENICPIDFKNDCLESPKFKELMHPENDLDLLIDLKNREIGLDLNF
jgi:hypothetical protein